MPIEVKELIIKATVQEEGKKGGGKGGKMDDATKDEIIMECVDKILRLLKNKRER